MEQLREIRRRIASIDEVRQITKAMYTIALSRTFRLKEQLRSSRTYLTEATRVFRAVLAGVELKGGGGDGDGGEAHPLIQGPSTPAPAGGPRGVFVVNSDRGLCGRFPEELNRRAEELLREGAERIICGGERARRYFSPRADRRFKIIKEYIHFYDRPTFAQGKEIARDLMALFQAGELGAVDAVYMRFHSDLRQEVVVERLLPFPSQLGEPEEGAESEPGPRPLRLYEPSAWAVLEGFALQYLAARVYNILVESKTSEQAIRRQAMKNATDNADELIEELTLQFNKARQQAITKEIADIIGGAEALRRG